MILVCTSRTFRPVGWDHVSWLEPETDYCDAAVFWARANGTLSFQTWEEAHSLHGYRYAAKWRKDDIIAVAAELPFSSTASELSAVMTAPEQRRQGNGRMLSSFVTAHILESAALATCQTRDDKTAMIRLAQSVGFVMASSAQANWIRETQQRFFQRVEGAPSTELDS